MAIPKLRLQKATKPAPPLTQEGGQGRGCVRPCVGSADDGGAPGLAQPCPVIAHSVGQFVVLHQAVGIEPAHG